MIFSEKNPFLLLQAEAKKAWRIVPREKRTKKRGKTEEVDELYVATGNFAQRDQKQYENKSK